MRRRDPGERVISLGARQLDREGVLDRRKDVLRKHRLHTDRADPLDVRMAAQGQEPGAFPTDVPSEQRQAGYRLDGVAAVEVMGDAHAPGEDGVLRPRDLACQGDDRSSVEP